jgi:hypothetical protein
MAGIPHILAGMPSLRVTEIGEMRLQTISFFLLAFLLATFAVQGLWNWLRRDFDKLPKLTYRRSLALVTLWGLLFVLVLTMISGARELMTPGAWEPKPDSLTYQLTNSRPEPPPTDTQRTAKLEALRTALWTYAASHNDQLPPSAFGPELPADVWETTDLSRVRYVYIPGRTRGDANALIAYEPAVFGAAFGLYGDGDIRRIKDADIVAARSAKP